MAELWPVVPHGVKLSLGSAEGIDVARARALGALARELHAPVISEHVAFVRSGEREIGHLTSLPFTRTSLHVVKRNVAQARRYLPDVPLLLENVAWTFRYPESEMEEGDFYAEVAHATGCSILLDLGNLYANAVNSGKDPLESLMRFPLERVAMVHLAGGVSEDGFFFDDHAHAISEPVFSLLGELLAVTGPVPILIERDASFPPFAELAGEVERCRTLSRRASRVATHKAPVASLCRDAVTTPLEGSLLARTQAEVARLLTDVEEPDVAAEARYGAAALRRSRAVLQRKRVDEALPLLPCLSQRRALIERVAKQVVESSQRLPRLAAISDALEIARRTQDITELRALAERDVLVLESRFVHDLATGQVNPRRSPYMSIRRFSDGGRGIAIKGFGTRAHVKFFERKESRL